MNSCLLHWLIRSVRLAQRPALLLKISIVTLVSRWLRLPFGQAANFYTLYGHDKASRQRVPRAAHCKVPQQPDGRWCGKRFTQPLFFHEDAPARDDLSTHFSNSSGFYQSPFFSWKPLKPRLTAPRRPLSTA